MTPEIAVVMPFRDAEPFLEEALESVRGQTMARWVALCVDDGSKDEGPARVAALAARDPRFRLIQPGPIGLPAALNVGMRAARAVGARFIARFDSDDVCRPRRFEAQVDLLEARPDVDVVDSVWDPIGEGSPGRWDMAYRAWHASITTHEDVVRELLVESPVCHPAVMFRAAALPPAPLYVDDGMPEDYAAWLRLVRGGLRFHKLSEALLGWRRHPGRTTHHHPRYSSSAFFAAKHSHAEATVLASRPRVAVWGGGKTGRPWIRALVDGGHDLDCVIDVDPRMVGRTRHGVPVVAPDDLAARGPEVVFLAVGVPGARAVIEPRIEALGMRSVAVTGVFG